MNSETIYYTKQYGRISVNLKDIMDKQGINRNMLARKINTRFEVVNKWYNGDVEKIDLDILARICYVLNCEVKDIVKYEKPSD